MRREWDQDAQRGQEGLGVVVSGTYQALGNSLFPRTYLAVYLWGDSWDRVGFRNPPLHPTHTQGSQVMLPKAHPALCYHTRPQLHG